MRYVCNIAGGRLFDLRERYDSRGVVEQLCAVVVANRGVEEQRDAFLVSDNESPVHTHVEVSDLWIVRSYVGGQQRSTWPHIFQTHRQAYEEALLEAAEGLLLTGSVAVNGALAIGAND